MGKARIVNHISDSQYSVIYYHDMTVIDFKLTRLTDELSFYASEIINYNNLIDIAQDAYDDQESVVEGFISAYSSCINGNQDAAPEFEVCKGAKEALYEANLASFRILSELNHLKEVVQNYKLSSAKATKEQERLSALTGEESMNLYCVDLCDRDAADSDAGVWKNHGLIIPPDTIVGTIEVFNFENKEYDIFIKPASYSRDPAYVELEDGISASSLASNEWGFVFNYNMRGPQATWAPFYRLATITGIENGLSDVQYDENLDQDKIIFNTIDSTANTNIPADYMVCNSSPPFEAGDNVIVRFGGVHMNSPEVIGYQYLPKPCAVFDSLLACQLSSGATTFEYSIPDNNIVQVSNNNLTANEAGGLGAVTNSLTWVSTSGVIVSTVFTDFRELNQSKIDPGSGPDIPTVSKRIDTLNNMVMVNRSWVAQIPSVVGSDVEVSGAAFMKNIAGTDYITAYRFRSFPYRIEKYQVIYDPNIDQSTIVDMPLVDSIDMNAYNTTNGTSLRFPKYVNATAFDVTGDPTEGDRVGNIAGQNRILTTNADGDKTLLFFTVNDADSQLYSDFWIYELTDNDLEFSITKHSEFIAKRGDASGSSDTTNTNNGMTRTRITTNIITNCDNYPVSYTYLYDVEGTYSGSGNYSRDFIENRIHDHFLGVSYDRYTGQVIVLSRTGDSHKGSHIERNWHETGVETDNSTERQINISQGGPGSYYYKLVLNTVMNFNQVSARSSLKINGVTIKELQGNSSDSQRTTTYFPPELSYPPATNITTLRNSSKTWSQQPANDTWDVTVDFGSDKEFETLDFEVVDLASRIFAYEVESKEYINGVAEDITRIIINADGIETIASATITGAVGPSIRFPDTYEPTYTLDSLSGEAYVDCENQGGGTEIGTYI